MSLKPGKKIIINKAGGAGSSKSPAAPRKRPSIYLPPQEEKSNVWVIWVIVALVVVALIVSIGVGVSRSGKEPDQEEYSSTSGGGAPGRQERLWMGDYMKQHGSPEELRKRQEQVRKHESRKDIVQ